MSVLRISDLTIDYRLGQWSVRAVDHVSLEIEA